MLKLLNLLAEILNELYRDACELLIRHSAQEITSNGEAKANGKTLEEQLWMETFPGRQSGTDWTRAAALSLLGWTFLPPGEMDTWWRVIGGENTLWRWAEIFFGTNHEVLSDTVWADNLATLCYIALRLLDVLF